jgi:hypothetical protein
VVAESLVLELETSSPIGMPVSCLNSCASIVLDLQNGLALDNAEEQNSMKTIMGKDLKKYRDDHTPLLLR